MLRSHTTRIAVIIAANVAAIVLADDQITMHGMDAGYFISSPGAQASTLVTSDFAEGVASHLGRYKVIAREQISAITGAVTGGAFVIVTENGDTIQGVYTGQATFQPTSATWTAEGRIESGTGRFAGVSGTISFKGSSDLSACKSVAALTVCPFTETTTASVALP